MRLAGLGPRQTPLHNPGQFQGPLKGSFLTACNDHFSDAAAGTLFTIIVQNIGNLLRAGAVDNIRRRRAVIAHAHIKRPVFLKRKPALSLVNLHRRHTDIQHHAIYHIGSLIQIGKRVLYQLQAVAKLRCPIGGHLKNTGIAVYSDHPARAGLEQIFAIATGPKGAIDPGALNGCSRFNQWDNENRDMRRRW